MRARLPSLPFLLLLLAATASAQDASGPVPAEAQARVDVGILARTRRAPLELAFTPRGPIERTLLVRVELRDEGRRLWQLEHAPATPTRNWQTDRVVRYEVPLALPLHFELGERPRLLEVWLGFFDPRSDFAGPPRGDGPVQGGLRRVATFELGPAGRTGSPDAATIDARIAEAEAWAKDGRSRAAWDLLTGTHREIEDYELKARLRDVLLRIGRFAPRPIDAVEHGIVQQRIAEERRRYVRQVASRMLDRDELHGALYLLRKIGGSLEEGIDQAHIGDLDRVRRHRLQIEDVERRLLNRVPSEPKARIDTEVQEKGITKDLMKQAEHAIAKGEFGLARYLLQILTRGQDAGLRQRALALFPEVEQKLLAALPDAEKAKADAAWDHPAWARTHAIPTHEFIVIGPKTLLGGISETSKLRYDLAYLYLTDLFGRVPNPDGDRVTVYFKELWDFGGGVGGGKRIDVGQADPEAQSTQLDNGLLYHELVHCVDDTQPLLGGFREGLADFGAAFVFEALGQRTPVRWSYVHNLKAFEEDYLERDLEFWRIPDYGPSAGFFLWFIEQYGKKGQKRQWQLYRRFFRAYRQDPVRDGRTPSVARALAVRLMQQFGPEVFADLQRFRFPLEDSDRAALPQEQQDAKGEYLPDPATFEKFPNSPVPRDVTAFGLAEDRAPLGDWAAKLGVVRAWQAIGPFKDDASDPGARVWPPEFEVDFSKTYDVPRNTALWRGPTERPPIRLGETGWLSFHWEYMDNSAIYALTHLRVPEARDARLWLRADDELTVFVNDELVGHYAGPQNPMLGPWRPGRGVLVADAIVFDVRLRAGRNKVLIKIRNYHGGAGLVLAVSDPAGQPVPGLVADAEPPMQITHHLPDTTAGRWRRRLAVVFEKRGSERCLEDRSGSFGVRNRRLAGTESGGGVPWRKYSVRPSFHRDAPSNFAWLRDKYTKDLEDFRLELGLSGEGAPKLAICFQGQGLSDPLSGWTLILHPDAGGVRLRLERYDRLVYQSARTPWTAPEESVPLRLELRERRVSVHLGETMLFDQVPIRPIPGRTRIGLATWNSGTQLQYLKLEDRGR